MTDVIKKFPTHINLLYFILECFVTTLCQVIHLCIYANIFFKMYTLTGTTFI